jgi:hypothetical protein
MLRIILFTLAGLAALVGAVATFAPTSAARLALAPSPATVIGPGRVIPPTPARQAQARAAADARHAIDTITARTAAPAALLAAIPPDFATTMGYIPVLGRLADGREIAINPNGGCSVVGGGSPFDLATPCKAHDLGYDLLRYSHRHGVDLPARARHEVDDTFGADLDRECAARYQGVDAQSCDMMAGSFDLGVGFNSWRQQFEAPVANSGLTRTIGVLLLATTAAAAGGAHFGRRMFRRTLAAPLAPPAVA